MLYSHYANRGVAVNRAENMAEIGSKEWEPPLDSEGLPAIGIRPPRSLKTCARYLWYLAKYTTSTNWKTADIRVRALTAAIKALTEESKRQARLRWEAMQTRKLLQGSAPMPDPPAPKRTRVDKGADGDVSGGV